MKLRSPWILALALALGVGSNVALAEYRQTLDSATIGYEGPSLKAAPQWLYSRGTPLEIVVSIEGWIKARDASGALAWFERKALGERNIVQVKAATADVHGAADASSPIVFRAEQGVLLQLVSPQTPSVGAWAQVRHRDGQTGYVAAEAVFGL